jgi:hypothetical protein
MGRAHDKHGGREVHTMFYLGNLRERDHLENIGIGGRIILECILNKSVGKAWTGLIWLRMGTDGRLL